MNDDLALLREYAANQSEAAFATLATRHVSLVYSVALRQVRNPHLAEEITQAVFIILARKADKLSRHVVLPGWLCRTARYASAEALRNLRRRRQREQEAHMQSILTVGGDDPSQQTEEAWQQIAPLLDAAMEKLGQRDHDAVVLRFFQNKNFAEVGAALGASESAAKMRVNRALEKLRKFFFKRGIQSTASGIAETISANSIHAAPAGLASKLSVTAVKGVATTAKVAALVKGTMNFMAWAKAKIATGLAAGVLIAAGTTTVVVSNSARVEPAYMSQLKKEGGMVAPLVMFPREGRHKNQLNLWFATDASFATLTNAQEIEDLEIVGTDLRTPAFNLISNLTHLKSFSTVNCKLMPAQLAVFQDMTNLEDLKLELIPAILEQSSEARAKLLGELSPEETQTAAMLKRVEVIKGRHISDSLIQAALLTDRAMPFLSRLTRLKTLDLTRAYISPAGLKPLMTLTNLEKAVMSPMGLNEQSALPFQAMSRLRSLEYFNVDDGVVATLSKITSLQYLNLWSGGVTDASTNYFDCLTNLNHLEIRGNQMSDAGLKQLAQLPKLKYLDLGNAKNLTPDGLAQFRNLRPDVEIK